MAPRGRSKKRVRIKSGHEARYIESRMSRKRLKHPMTTIHKKKPPILKSKLNSKLGSDSRTVSELVYRFLEARSKSGANRFRKTNAANQFRKHQRRSRSKRLKPVKRTPSIVRSIAEDDDDDESYVFPCTPVPSKRANESIEECIYDVLSFGTMMGLLEPVDSHGVVFRVASDLDLFERAKSEGEKRMENHSCRCDKNYAMKCN